LHTGEGFVKLAATIRNQMSARAVAMTQQFAVPDNAPPHHPHYGDAFVVFSVTVLSCAVGAWLLLRLGMALWVGSLTALGVYTLLLSFHLLVRRSLIREAGAATPVASLGTQRPAQFAEDPGLGAPAPSPQYPQPEAPAPGREPPIPGKRRPEALPRTRPADPFKFRPSREPLLSPASLPGFPRDPGPGAGEPRASLGPAAAGAAPPELRVELVQELIKKLADELNTTTATRGERPMTPPPRASAAEAAIDRSVDALESMARSMHARPRMKTPAGRPQADAAGSAMPTGRPTPGSDPSAGLAHRPHGATPPELNPQLARITEAVAAERMEVLLEPIHALVEGRPRHFEVSTRLITADGTALDRREYATAARGSGLMPRIDAAKMIRAARIASRLGERGREGAVLASLTGDVLIDQAFLEAVTAGSRADGLCLVLAFAQSEVRAFTPGHVKALGDLAALGFRFALEEVVDLDMDFAALKDMGFTFVELDAPVFLDGLPAAGSRVPAADISRHLANFGLALIVGHIDDDWLLARILGFGVLFGKGALFGGPRLLKDEVVAAPTAA
jgi:cyclic-di-GMP phosphodiesterase TipF (flagellum assembly factor)